MSVDKSTIYYLIIGATFLLNFAFIPLLFEVLQTRQMSNIPYFTLICFLIAQALFLFVVFFVCIWAVLFLRYCYDGKNIHLIKKYTISEE